MKKLDFICGIKTPVIFLLLSRSLNIDSQSECVCVCVCVCVWVGVYLATSLFPQCLDINMPGLVRSTCPITFSS